MTIDPRHAPLLAMIDPALLDGRVRSTEEGLEFEWHSPDGRVTTQRRPDDPDGGPKYLWRRGVELPIGVPAGMGVRLADRDRPLLIVEGTKQHLAAATQALADPQGEAVVGIASCWGFLHDGSPTRDALALPMVGRRVLVCMDADVSSNRDVHDAAERLAEFCDVEGGASSVEFVVLPGSKDGFDDILGRAADPAATYRRLISRATRRLPKKPRPTNRRGYFDFDGKFLVADMYRDIAASHKLAVTEENSIAVYRDGVYWNGLSKHFNRIVFDMLGNDFRKVHLDNVHETAVTMLRTEGRIIPHRPDRCLVNVRNGLLDPVTLELHPHDPDFLSLYQFDVYWDPDATCPTFDRWIEEVLPGRGGELLDAVAPMFDPTRTPTKAPFLYGPSRSGKSTYGRLVKRLVGPASTASVTLQQLSDDRFAAANLYGKVLNLAMDLSSRDVKDLSTFKMMTGEDPIGANRKYGQQFSFTNQALIVFSANEVPAVSETSKAWMSRVAPFKFPNSFIGAEDPSIEEAMMGELPGIFRRHILALRDQLARGGGYLFSDHEDVEEFARKSNKVEEYLFDRTRRSENPEGTARPVVLADYRIWCENNGYQALGKSNFYAALRTAGVDEFKPKGGAWKFELVIEDPEHREPDKEKEESDDEVGRESAGGDEAARDGSVGVDEVRRVGRDAPGRRAAGRERGDQAGPVLRVPRDGSAGRESGEGVAEGPKLTPESAASAKSAISNTNRRALPPTHNSPSAKNPPAQGGSGLPTLPTSGPVAIDLETASADLLFAGSPDFVRLACTPDGPVDPSTLAGRPLVAHNGFGFDFHALGLDVTAEGDAGRLVDTLTLGLLAHPPLGGQGGERVLRDYGLEDVAGRLGLGGKSGDLKALAKKHGGFDAIPVDDPEYVAYCTQDAALAGQILDSIGLDDYARREMRVMSRLAGPITGTGFRVDTKLLERRLAEGDARRAQLRDELVTRYGMPSTGKAPQATKAGKAAIVAAFAELGVAVPLTEKGSPSLGKGGIGALDLDGAAGELRDTVLGLNGVRTVYGTIAEHTIDGRVHPSVLPLQASGRFSITNPGLTVLGKRGGKHIERDVLIADEGCLLVAFDLNQIDARAVALHSQDPEYLKLFEPGRDSHTEVAMALWGDPDRREQAKAIAHGWNYGEGVRKLVANTGLPQSTIYEFDEGMRRRFPKLVEWRKNVYELGRAGAILDNGFGRKLKVDPERAYTQAPAYMGQSTARDLMVAGVLRLPLDVVRMIRAFVHDEVVLSIPEADLDEVRDLVLKAFTFKASEVMTPPGPLDVDITAGASRAARSWGRCYEKEA